MIFSLALYADQMSFDHDVWMRDIQMLIKLDTQNSVRGFDKNKNMVRDDVEEYINDRYSSDKFQKVMFLAAAKKIQQIITLPKGSSVATHRKLDDELLQIYTCRDYILYTAKDMDISQELNNKIDFKNRVLNTKERLLAYIKHKKLLPFEFSIPNDEVLNIQRVECNKLYKKIYKDSEGRYISRY
jgi:hypothetical protein